MGVGHWLYKNKRIKEIKTFSATAMKYLVALLLLASYFNLAEFHPIDEIIVSEIADFTKDSSDYLIGVNLIIL